MIRQMRTSVWADGTRIYHVQGLTVGVTGGDVS